MRGLLLGLVARAYFAGDPANVTDPILNLIDPNRRYTLLLTPSAEDPHHLTWTLYMQGPTEAVFLDF